MKKKKLNIILISKEEVTEYNLLGEYDEENNIIYYNENNNLVTKMKLDLKNKELTRENKDYYLEYKFIENEETENKMVLKELDKNIFINIKTDKFKLEENKLEIIYTILDSDEQVTYKVKF